MEIVKRPEIFLYFMFIRCAGFEFRLRAAFGFPIWWISHFIGENSAHYSGDILCNTVKWKNIIPATECNSYTHKPHACLKLLETVTRPYFSA